jgi:glycosyltransferase involved in cell wall biosynthesis
MVAPISILGGMEEILFGLATTLPSEGIVARVVCLRPGPLVDRLAEHGIEPVLFDSGRIRNAARFATTVSSLRTLIRREQFDLVYSNMPKAHLYVAPAVGRQQLPTLWCQGGIPERPHWLDRAATALPATGIIALSREAVESQRQLAENRMVHLMHPGTDLSRFRVGSDPDLRQQHRIPVDAPLVSIVGRLQPWKGQSEFLHAARLLTNSHPKAHFAVIGGAVLGWEGNYSSDLENLATDLGIKDRVTFTGHTTDVHRWMSASDIVVNASQPEPFGLVVVEAMACGCAVVAVDGGGPRDIISHGDNGLLCASRAPEHLAGLVELLLKDPEARRRIGAAARCRVETQFSREAMAARFATIVRDSIRARRSSFSQV